MNPFDLKQHGLTVTEVHRNISPSALYEHATRRGVSELVRKFLTPLFCPSGVCCIGISRDRDCHQSILKFFLGPIDDYSS